MKIWAKQNAVCAGYKFHLCALLTRYICRFYLTLSESCRLWRGQIRLSMLREVPSETGLHQLWLMPRLALVVC